MWQYFRQKFIKFAKCEQTLPRFGQFVGQCWPNVGQMCDEAFCSCLLACLLLFVLANKSLVKNLRGDHYLWGLLQCPPKSVAVFFSCGYQSHMYSTSFSLGTTQSLRGGKKSMKLKKHASKIQAKRTWKFMSTGLTTKNTG